MDTTSDDGAGSHHVTINSSHCADLLTRTVSRTRGHTVDSLLRLHNQMSLCVYQHRHNYDKTQLVKVKIDLLFYYVVYYLFNAAQNHYYRP